MTARPPTTTELIWSGDLRFAATAGSNTFVIDGRGTAGASPMQHVAAGLAGCMAADVVDILRKGRHPVTALRLSLTAERAETPPRHFTSISMQFVVHGAVPGEAVERAIALSRERYCSAWHSLRTDIELTTGFQIHA